MDTIKISNKQRTQMIAHRGLSGIETENTVQAFIAAGKYAFYGIECDVHLTKDGKYIIFHDDSTGRLCEKDLIIEQTDFETLRKLKFKDGVSHMPSLEEYLQIVSKYGKVAVIEIKNRMPEKNIGEIISICKEWYKLDKIIFISFCFENLLIMRKLLPEQSVQYLTDKYEDGLMEMLKENKFGLDIGWWLLTEEIVNKLHENGVAVNCWTCDEKQSAQQLISFGVDFITTDIME